MSVSGDYGIVNQIEFQGRSFAGASVSNYGVVQTGDVVYTKSPLNSNPYGIIKTNKGKPGIVSTLYAVYHPKENAFSDFIQVYFEQHARMNNYMHPLVNKGAKNDMKVSAENALKGPVCFPSRIEQESISAFFSVLDNLITLHQRQPFLHSPPDISLIVQLTPPFYTFSWEQRKLGNIADIVGGGTPSTGNQSYWDGDIDWYAPAEIADQIYANSSQKKITGLGYENSSAKMLPPGTVLFTSRAGIGKTAILTRKGCTNQGFQSIVPHRGELDSYFIFSRTEELKRYGELVGAGSTFVEVSGKQMAVMELMMPPTMREQQTIGGFFQQLDHLITLHQRKFEKLTNVKKSMLEKMFPQNGCSYPEIRFKGFTDAWEQRKVGNLLIERNQQAPMSDEYPLMAFIANEGVAPKGERYDRSALVTDTVSKLYKKTEKGDFIYSSNNLETGSIGLNKYGKACISPVYSIFEPTGIADSDFLGRRLVRKDFINAMVKWRQGVIYGQWRIHESDFLKIEITVPSVEEQRKIGAYLDQLDNLITLHQRELEKLQNIKKSMLEKMFV